ncbi:MAG TPA: histidine kinase dimerization/phospho-acceptor domain-containing protein [Nitrospirota bacterium]
MNRYGKVLILAGLGMLLLITAAIFVLWNTGPSLTDGGTNLVFLLSSALIAATAFLIASAIYLHQRVLAPLSGLLAAAEEIGRGNLDRVMPAQGAREIVALGERFNDMAAQLRQARADREKMAGLERLGSALRHEINNPLSTIIGNVELLIERYEGEDQELEVRLEAILNNSLRIADIVKRSQDFNREQPANAERRGAAEPTAGGAEP